jgi:hypothetical protein
MVRKHSSHERLELDIAMVKLGRHGALKLDLHGLKAAKGSVANKTS